MLPRQYHDPELKCGGPQMCGDCRDRLEQEMKRDEKIGPGLEDDSFSAIKRETKAVAEWMDKMEDKIDECKKQPDDRGGHRYSVNNRLVVEPYLKEGLKSEVKKGFAMVSQKVQVKGLKLLLEARLNDGIQTSTILPRGSIVYIREELLHTQPWAQKQYQAEGIEGPFMLVDLINVEFVST